MKKELKKLECRYEFTGEELIHIDCVSHEYPDGTVGLDNLCFSVYPGEIIAICGPNGSGKTTLLEHLVGLLVPKEGRIMIFSEELKKKNYNKIRKMVGLIFQYSDDQLFAPTVLDDVMFGPRNLGFSKEDALKKAYYALETVFGEYPKDLVNKVPHYLSGGEKKLVAIAGVLAMQPKIIVADEITANLDPKHSRIIEKLLEKLRDELNISVVFATHNLDMVMRIADRVCLIDKGTIIKEGAPQEIFTDSFPLKIDLEFPQIVKVYRNMIKIIPKLNEYPIPKSVEEFNKLIVQVFKTK